MIQREFQLIIQRDSVPPPSLPSLMVFILTTRDPAHCLMSYLVIMAPPTPSHLAITTCQYTCDPIKCCRCVFFVQIHASIWFSSYETVCRLVAQNSNHRKSVILYLIITLPVMLALGPSFTQDGWKWLIIYKYSLIHSSLTQQGKYKDEKYCMTYFLRNGAHCTRIPGTFM